MKIKIVLLIGILSLFLHSSVWAIPVLQVDIENGTYDTGTETVVLTTGSTATVYALFNPPKKGVSADDTFYMSVALVPTTGGVPAGGFFDFDGTIVNVIGDMTYGTPSGLPSHGIFDTYYSEFSFNFSEKTFGYNVEDNPGGFTGVDSNGDFYFREFLVDVSGLTGSVALHIDLYSKNADGSVNKFSPFSHDGEISHAPVPASVYLLGTGLIGLAGFRGRKKLIS